MPNSPLPKSRIGLTVLCFACVYLIWGSTYLAIKIAIAEMPPLLMAACRFTLAGIILTLVGKIRKEGSLSAADRKLAFFSGCLLVLANSLVCLAEKWISSGTTAVLIGSVPIWIVILNFLFFKGGRPTNRTLVGITISVLGVFLLSRSQLGAGLESAHPSSSLGVFFILASVILWSFGTLLQKKVSSLEHIFTFSGFQLGMGSLISWALGLMFEHPTQWSLTQFSGTSVAAFFYLVIFGSAIAFSAYLWLSRNIEPAKVSTYAVVNPLTAVWLGWLFANEAFGAATIGYSVLILTGTYLVVFKPRTRTIY